MSRPRTFVMRLDLSTKFNRSTQDSSSHWAGTTVKGYRVLDTNLDTFKVDIVADPDNGSIQGIPVGQVRIHNYSTLAKNAVFENSVVQPGVWVTILISVEDALLWTDQKVQKTDVTINEGGSHSSSSVALVALTPTVIFTADSTRMKGVFQNKSGESIWVGNDSAGELQAANYQDVCEEVGPGSTFEWKNRGALSGKSVGATKVSVRNEIT